MTYDVNGLIPGSTTAMTASGSGFQLINADGTPVSQSVLDQLEAIRQQAAAINAMAAAARVHQGTYQASTPTPGAYGPGYEWANKPTTATGPAIATKQPGIDTKPVGIDYSHYAGMSPAQIFTLYPNGLPAGWDWAEFSRITGAAMNPLTRQPVNPITGQPTTSTAAFAPSFVPTSQTSGWHGGTPAVDPNSMAVGTPVDSTFNSKSAFFAPNYYAPTPYSQPQSTMSPGLGSVQGYGQAIYNRFPT